MSLVTIPSGHTRSPAQGIGNPMITSIGSDHTTEMQGPRRYEARTTKPPGRGALLTTGVYRMWVEVLDFADSTGVVSNFRTLNLNSTTGQVYGT